MEKTATQIAKENFDIVMGAASFDFKQVANLENLFELRKKIAIDYKIELKEEFDSINKTIREYLSL